MTARSPTRCGRRSREAASCAERGSVDRCRQRTRTSPRSGAFFSNGHRRRWRRDVPVPPRPREWPLERRRGSHRPSADEDVRSPKHSSQMVMAGVGGGTSPSRNGRGSGHSRAGEAATDRRRTRTSAILSFFSQMVTAGVGGGTSPSRNGRGSGHWSAGEAATARRRTRTSAILSFFSPTVTAGDGGGRSRRSGAFFSNGHGRRWRRDVPVPLRPRKWPLERRRDSHRPSADEDVRDPGTR